MARFNQDYTNDIQSSTNLLIYTAIGMLGVLVLLAVLLSWFYIKDFKHEIIEITSIFLLISYDSIIKNEVLKNQFMEKM